MQIIELIALNQSKYEKILILKIKDDSKDPYIKNATEVKLFNDMNLVDKEYYSFEAKDYFLLDLEGLKAVVYRDQEIDLNLESNENILVIII